ncbi:MAG TPA: BlaI/MecI/CopY family transcriptional regulator [Tepidisphaeraceae bacterium]|jgi:predicted transcriptional regulator
MPARSPIAPGELRILRYIQEAAAPVTVRQVADHVAQTRGHVRTTVLNVMTRLVRKGYLVRRKREGVYEYSPRQPAGQLFRGLVRDFVDKALGGSPSPFVAYLAEDAGRLSTEDVEQLKRLVRELEKGSPPHDEEAR